MKLEHLERFLESKDIYNRKIKVIGKGNIGAVYLVTYGSNPSKEICIKENKQLDRGKTEKALYDKAYPSALSYSENFNEVFEHKGNKIHLATIPFFEGKPLNKVAKNLPYKERIKIAACLCDELSKLAEKSIVHRDLKMDNIIVKKEEEKWQVNIIDFGRAIDLNRTFADEDEDEDEDEKALNHEKRAISKFFKYLKHKLLEPQVAPEYTFFNSTNFIGNQITSKADVYALGNIFKKLLPENKILIKQAKEKLIENRPSASQLATQCHSLINTEDHKPVKIEKVYFNGKRIGIEAINNKPFEIEVLAKVNEQIALDFNPSGARIWLTSIDEKDLFVNEIKSDFPLFSKCYSQKLPEALTQMINSRIKSGEVVPLQATLINIPGASPLAALDFASRSGVFLEEL